MCPLKFVTPKNSQNVCYNHNLLFFFTPIQIIKSSPLAGVFRLYSCWGELTLDEIILRHKSVIRSLWFDFDGREGCFDRKTTKLNEEKLDLISPCSI